VFSAGGRASIVKSCGDGYIGLRASASPPVGRPRLDLSADAPGGADPYAGDVVRNAVMLLWSEARVPDAPRRVWRDWALVGVLVPTAILEGSLRSDVVWRPVALPLAIGLVFTLLWRRTHPLATTAIGFGAVIAVDVAALVSAAGLVGLYSNASILLLPYALLRWGSGREALIGLAITLVAGGLGIALDYNGVVEAVLGSFVLLFPAALGASVRYRATARVRELDQVKLREREQLARELHDTVAHHVSAIAIRAQAGRVVAPSDPLAAASALEVIEEEASRALVEMRVIVAALRDGEEADLRPEHGVSDIERLARTGEGSPRLEVELTGDLDHLGPSIGSAIYHLAQESITNARRHARSATRIEVKVVGDDDCVRLTVRDDGEVGRNGRGALGYGLVGMTERATLLGGTLEAGPTPDRGWLVAAALPRGEAVRR